MDRTVRPPRSTEPSIGNVPPASGPRSDVAASAKEISSMTANSDAELYHRGAATMVASWETYARGTPGAVVVHAPGVAAAVFPREPERGVYNNALLTRDLAAAARADALDAMEAAYAAAGVAHFAAWVQEGD